MSTNIKFNEKIDKEKVFSDIEHVFKRMHDEKKTLKEVLGVKDEFLEEMYGVAYNFYEQGKIKEAHSLFQVLVGVEPENFRYMFGIASCHHQLGEYRDAAGAYAIALSTEPLNPMPAYYLADCYYHLEFKSEAKQALELTIELCQDDEKFKVIKEQSKLLLNKLESSK